VDGRFGHGYYSSIDFKTDNTLLTEVIGLDGGKNGWLEKLAYKLKPLAERSRSQLGIRFGYAQRMWFKPVSI